MPVRKDLMALQGHWRQVAFEENGWSDLPDSHGAPDAVTTITRQSFQVRRRSGGVLLAGDFRMDGGSHPKRIDWIDSIGARAGQVIPAIYELEEDHFRFAAADPGQARPEGFDGGAGITSRAFVRLWGRAAAGGR